MRKILRTRFVLSVLALAFFLATPFPPAPWVTSVAAQSTMNRTTLSAAVTSTTTVFINLTSTSNITAGDVVMIDQEAMLVQATPTANPVQVRRGYDGTGAATHLTGAIVWTGAASRFVVKDPLPGQCTPALVSQLALPVINTRNGMVWDCAQTNSQTGTYKWQSWSPIPTFMTAPRTAVASGAYTVVLSDYLVALTGPVSGATAATQSWTLPSHVGVPGKLLVFKDESGGLTATTFITLVGTVNGSANYSIKTAYGAVVLYAGTGGWYTLGVEFGGPR